MLVTKDIHFSLTFWKFTGGSSSETASVLVNVLPTGSPGSHRTCLLGKYIEWLLSQAHLGGEQHGVPTPHCSPQNLWHGEAHFVRLEKFLSNGTHICCFWRGFAPATRQHACCTHWLGPSVGDGIGWGHSPGAGTVFALNSHTCKDHRSLMIGKDLLKTFVICWLWNCADHVHCLPNNHSLHLYSPSFFLGSGKQQPSQSRRWRGVTPWPARAVRPSSPEGGRGPTTSNWSVIPQGNETEGLAGLWSELCLLQVLCPPFPQEEGKSDAPESWVGRWRTGSSRAQNWPGSWKALHSGSLSFPQTHFSMGPFNPGSY